MRKVILASGSPRRQAFLRELGIEFTILTADVDERPLVGEEPVALAKRLAEIKAQTVARRVQEDGMPVVIVAADTVVALENELLGKPEDAAEAEAMLRALRNRVHWVHSAVSVLALPEGQQETVVNSTQVLMRDYSAEEIADYVASGDPMDKAGAYAIQHPEFAPVASLQGCVAGVIGLPLGDLRRLLAAYGVVTSHSVVEVCERQTEFACCQRE